jgi:hypothetical protein
MFYCFSHITLFWIQRWSPSNWKSSHRVLVWRPPCRFDLAIKGDFGYGDVSGETFNQVFGLLHLGSFWWECWNCWRAWPIGYLRLVMEEIDQWIGETFSLPFYERTVFQSYRDPKVWDSQPTSSQQVKHGVGTSMFSANCLILTKQWLDQKQLLGLFVYPRFALVLNGSFMGWGLVLKNQPIWD